MSSLQGSVALVTGGAQGIGAGIVCALVEAGARVIIADLQLDRAEALSQSLPAGSAFAVQTDITRAEDIRAALAKAVDHFGRLDIVVNNAAPGRVQRKPFPENLDRWDHESDILLKAHAVIVAEALPLLRQSDCAAVVNMSSVLADLVSQESGAYHAAKAGVVQLTRYLAAQLGKEGIRVNAVAPGIVDRDVGPKLTDDPINRKVAEVAVPLGRAGSAADVGDAVVFLCSRRAAYITGQTLVVDGGLTIKEPFGVARSACMAVQQEP